MKTLFLSLLAVSAICSSNLAADKQSHIAAQTSSLVGTWELVSEKWGDAKEFSPPSAERKSIKFMTPTHFIWVWIDPKTKRVINTMGGTYKHEGDSYVETVEFGAPGMEAYIEKQQKFSAKLEGDKWTHSGVLSEGQKLEEIWKKVK